MIGSQKIKEIARNLGFDLVGISPATTPERDLKKYQAWLDENMHCDMKYMEKTDPRSDLSKILQNAKSVISCALNYNQEIPSSLKEYKVARYALGKDYHKVVLKKLKLLWKEIKKENPEANGKYYVDTGPILERAFAQSSGIGWIGKNTMLISKEIGSYIFLGEIITNIEFEPDSPATDHCGTCTACLDSCPTKALPEPGVLDAKKCISYWTIEHRGEFPKEIESKISNHLFGCDICQEVCPWNRKAPITTEEKFIPLLFPSLEEIEGMKDKEYSTWFQGRPLKRTGFDGLTRNARTVSKNRQS